MRAATPIVDWPLRAALLPILAVQGMMVRQGARVLSEPVGPRVGTTPGATKRLLVIGDSSAAGVGCSHQSQALATQIAKALAPEMPVDWQLMATCGARTQDGITWLDTDPPGPIDLAVTVFGVNDVTKGTTGAQWQARQSVLIDTLHRLGAAHVFACALPPMGHFPLLPNPLRWVLGRQALAFDQRLVTLCASRAYAHHVPFDFPMTVNDMAEDGYHPGPAIYADWGEHLAGLILAVTRP